MVLSLGALAIALLGGTLDGVRPEPDRCSHAIGNGVFEARINTSFSSMLGCLLDAGLPDRPRAGLFYGYWTSADATIADQWHGMHEPVYDPVRVESGGAPGSPWLECELAYRPDPSLRIVSRYELSPGAPGFRLIRTYRDTDGEGPTWGPAGMWVGGVASMFPHADALPPDSYWLDGRWSREIVDHIDAETWREPPGPVRHAAILHWSSQDRWLASVSRPELFSGAIRGLTFGWRSEWQDPAWAALTGPFREATVVVDYLVGSGSPEEAEGVVTRFAETGEWPSAETAEPALAPEPEMVTLESPWWQVEAMAASGWVESLRHDPSGQGRWGEELLPGRASLALSGGSHHQRSVYPEHTEELALVTTDGSAALGKGQITLTGLLLRDPLDGGAIAEAHAEIRLDGPWLELEATVTPREELRLPYLGWWLDVPAGSFEEFHGEGGGFATADGLGGYRMSFLDLQPYRRPFAAKILALPGASREALELEAVQEPGEPPRWVGLPNPLYDDALGIQRLVVSASGLDWQKHNCPGTVLPAGRPHRVAMRLRPIPSEQAQAPPSDTFEIRTPADPGTGRTLTRFYREHCFGGAIGLGGCMPWFWRLAGKYSPHHNPELGLLALEEQLGAALPEPREIAPGVTLPVGALPLGRLADGSWMWAWNDRGYIFEATAQALLGIADICREGRRAGWVAAHWSELERAAGFYEALVGEHGTVTMPLPFDGLVGQGRSSTYWDAWCIGAEYPLLEVYRAATCRAMADLAELAGRPEDIATWTERAERSRSALLARYWSDSPTDDAGQPLDGGRFVSWIDREGKVRDVGFTDIPLLAGYLGLLEPERAEAALRWLDSDPNAYSWRDAQTGVPCGVPAINTVDGNRDQYWAGVFNVFQRAPGVENGQTMFWHAGLDWRLRAVTRGSEDAGRVLAGFLARARRGGLTSGHGLPQARPLPMYTGTNTMSADDRPVGSDGGALEDGMLVSTGIIEGMAGVRFDGSSLGLEPHLPEALRDLGLANLRLGSRLVSLRYVGWGDAVAQVTLDGEAHTLPIPAERLRDGCEIVVEMAGR